jgi:hypothetical protein
VIDGVPETLELLRGLVSICTELCSLAWHEQYSQGNPLWTHAFTGQEAFLRY